MPDDKSTTGPQDAHRVNIHEDYEVRYWSQRFGCTKAQLIAAVENAGVMVQDVERELKRR